MRDVPVIPISLVAAVIVMMEIIHFIYLGFDPALSVLIVFAVTGLIVFVILNMEEGDNK